MAYGRGMPPPGMPPPGMPGMPPPGTNARAQANPNFPRGRGEKPLRGRVHEHMRDGSPRVLPSPAMPGETLKAHREVARGWLPPSRVLRRATRPLLAFALDRTRCYLQLCHACWPRLRAVLVADAFALMERCAWPSSLTPTPLLAALCAFAGMPGMPPPGMPPFAGGPPPQFPPPGVPPPGFAPPGFPPPGAPPGGFPPAGMRPPPGPPPPQ